MFRVPVDPQQPSFDHTETIGFGRWLTSSGADRREWARRRNVAARLAGTNQRQRIAAERAPAPQVRHVAQPAPVDRTSRAVTRAARANLWFANIQLATLLIPIVVVVALVVVVLVLVL